MVSYEWGMRHLATERLTFFIFGVIKMYKNDIDYDKLIEKSLKNVVIQALHIAEEEGLNDNNHFYITFNTNHPKTRISAQLMSQYPEEMTIVLQHQYQNLMVFENHFSVDLSLGGVLQNLSISYDSITYFADPHAKFALSFNNSSSEFIDDELFIEEEHKKVSGGAQVISIDSFRKK